ncbi:hypothetical protein P9112_010966 [Eukaryota sp. TZLM1-RC]
MLSSQDCINLEHDYSFQNYHPLPVVLDRGEGANVYDVEGKKYIDCLSAYSAVNQGHCHPKIVKAMTDQAQKLALTSRAFYNSSFGAFCKFICEYFGYERCLMANGGVEAVEGAIKTARRWGYRKKGIPHNEAIIVTANDNFHGRTLGVISFSGDKGATSDFGPFTPGFTSVPYSDIDALKAVFEESGDRICAFLVEPIQGEAGVMVPEEEYLNEVRALCTQYNVLMITDEIQSGIGRSGKLLASDYADKNGHPDVVLLGKAVSGGLYPVSIVLTSHEIASVIDPGSHGSTYGGNPIACAVAKAALEVIRDEKLTERSMELGQHFRARLGEIQHRHPEVIKSFRGKGLLNAIIIEELANGNGAWEFCLLLMKHGVLAKPTHGTIVRLAPPLNISKEDLDKILDAFDTCCDEIQKVNKEEIPGYGM